jgi:DNA-nicking Smr family endonuclease
MGKKKKGGKVLNFEIDLHGLSLSEALAELDFQMSRILRTASGNLQVKVITGKGLHSGPEGPVLPREVHGHFASRYARYILSLEESPHAVALSGIPIRGHFTAKMRVSL